jgi:hypothetical protein
MTPEPDVWTCPRGHKVPGNYCTLDGSHRPIEPSDWEVPETPKAGRRSPWVLISGLAFLALVVLGTAGGLLAWKLGSGSGTSASGGSSTPVSAGSAAPSQGYNDPTFLANDLQDQINKKLTQRGVTSFTATSTFCVHQSGTRYSCNVQYSDGDSRSVGVTVASDGNSWVSGTS